MELDFGSKGCGTARALRRPPKRSLLSRALLSKPPAATYSPRTSYRTGCPQRRVMQARRAGCWPSRLSRPPRDYLMLFRKEIIHTVKWGGDPNKPVTVGPHGDRL